MRKMREIDGYMTLEASLIIPVLCFLLVLLFSFFFYIMDLGIVSGLVKEAGLHTEDKNQETNLRRDLERRDVYKRQFLYKGYEIIWDIQVRI